MKKTLIALTLASLPVAASADVVLYGTIKGGVEVSRNFTNDKTLNVIEGTTGVDYKQGTSTKIVDYGSRIGFKGHEDLSNNLRAIWQVEQNVSIGGSESGFSNRDSFVGLTGGFGTAKAGYLSTPTKVVVDRLDQWEYSDRAAGLGTYTRSTAAVGRKGAISYETPSFGGFTAQAYVSPSDNNNSNDSSLFSTNKNGDSAVYGAKLGYENAGFFADIAGTYVKNPLVGKKGVNQVAVNHDGYQAAASVGFDNGNWLAGVGYQQGRYVDNMDSLIGEEQGTVSTTANPSIIKRSQEVAASAAYTINNALRLKGSAAYGFGIDSMGNQNNSFVKDAKYLQGIVGADYLLSKRTALNGQVGYLEIRSKAANNETEKLKRGTVGVGMSHKF